ncbi:hypothetical protein B5P46_28095 [Rhizobium leguminosarum]|uniref:Uncharacterized protein n=1 Tax=Rhizobium leguminosarum TaxID=384 RepID=A0A4Q1TKT0_RHILE|nr:hypothetical protein [Rhizobium leguminosarum]RXT18757.1 hypothetical protein B5P46_28095 [Rhizobium leguminosarum]
MTDQIKIHGEFELAVPTGDILRAIIVDIEIVPPNGSVLIYGMTSPTTMSPIKVDGSKKGLQLPFINGKIKITHLGEVTKASIAARGWVDSVNRL